MCSGLGGDNGVFPVCLTPAGLGLREKTTQLLQSFLFSGPAARRPPPAARHYHPPCRAVFWTLWHRDDLRTLKVTGANCFQRLRTSTCAALSAS